MMTLNVHGVRRIELGTAIVDRLSNGVTFSRRTVRVLHRDGCLELVLFSDSLSSLTVGNETESDLISDQVADEAACNNGVKPSVCDDGDLVDLSDDGSGKPVSYHG